MSTLKLEAGKYYKTRDGRKAFVAAVELPNPFLTEMSDEPCSGFIADRKGTYYWQLDGAWGSDDESPYDLVAEWTEPKRVQGWMNVYQSGNFKLGSTIYSTEAIAEAHGGTTRIACIYIDVLEGEGL